MKLIKNGRKLLIAGVALAACIGFTLNANAQTCTVDNWTGATLGLTDANTGTPSANNRRYGGPCALRVDLDGNPAYVGDDKPAGTAAYIARFYAFLDGAGNGAVQIFAGEGNGDDQIQVWYNEPAAGDLTLRVYDSGSTANDLTFNSVGAGWHSIEFAWSQGAAADIAFSVDGAADLQATVDTSGLAIDNAFLGNISGANGGSIDFDDFDSRRDTRPGRLCRGDTDDDLQLSLVDVNNIFTEAQTFGATLSGGQPDFNEDGSVSLVDVNQVFNLVQTLQFNCPTP